MIDKLLDMGCKELRDKIAAGEVKSVAVTEAVFEAMGKYEPKVGADISTFKEWA